MQRRQPPSAAVPRYRAHICPGYARPAAAAAAALAAAPPRLDFKDLIPHLGNKLNQRFLLSCPRLSRSSSPMAQGVHPQVYAQVQGRQVGQAHRRRRAIVSPQPAPHSAPAPLCGGVLFLLCALPLDILIDLRPFPIYPSPAFESIGVPPRAISIPVGKASEVVAWCRGGGVSGLPRKQLSLDFFGDPLPFHLLRRRRRRHVRCAASRLSTFSRRRRLRCW